MIVASVDDYFPKRRYPVGPYNAECECLLRGTNRIIFTLIQQIQAFSPPQELTSKVFAKTQLSATSSKFLLNAAVQTQNLTHLHSFYPLLRATVSPLLHFSTPYLASSLPLQEGR
jgi:hypothetical protein